MNIPLVDLKSQYLKIEEEIKAAIEEVFNNTDFIQGAKVRSFESELSEFINSRFCITCGNGTDALQIALMALDLKPDDEVILPAFSYVAPLEAASLLGLNIYFTDVDSQTFNISCESLKENISPKTKLIIPVHLFGQCAPMEQILNIASKNNIAVLEDTAQSIGAEYSFSSKEKKFAGTMGTIGITSFFPSKNLGCYGDGGALFTNSESLAKKIRLIANHGQSQKYTHEIVGMNSRLDTIQAAVLSVKLKYLDCYNSARRKAAAYYDMCLSDCKFIKLPSTTSYSSHVYHQYTILVDESVRDKLKDFLQLRGISIGLYYPIPLHLQKAYAHLGYKEGDFPVSERLCRQVISLPMHTELTEIQLDYICSTILSFFR